ncbi:integrase [Ornithinimicrobium avium]|uniref:Integrase n=2 Tax=Ornithinimicrobium avium TaxID=2283195 RepID=A0A345NT15_9MICO|nr:integrase [Ornithinimicrobium avium]
MSFAAHAAVATGLAVDPAFVVTGGCRWGSYVRTTHRHQYEDFLAQATGLGFCARETGRMWAHLSRIAVIAGTSPAALTPEQYTAARAAFFEHMVARHGGDVPHRSLSTPLFGLDAVMFHRGQAPVPDKRRRWLHTRAAQVDWDHISADAPVLASTMRRYLAQCALSLRPSSVALFDTTLRQFAGYLLDHHPDMDAVAHIRREHVEGYKTWLAGRPGYRGRPGLSKTTLGMRMGHLRSFFTRIIEWDYDDVPARVPVYATDRPRLDRPLPKFLDDAQAAAFMNAARDLPDPLDRLIVQTLARTGMRRGELLGLTIDAVVQIGTSYWLRTPVGKLHTDRYIPLHPQVKDLIDDWLAHRASWQASDLLLLDRGRPIPPTRVDAAVRKTAALAGLGHVHPHQLRHTLATQAINRGMSLEAIAALLGHHDLSMTMVYARIGDRTVADQYFKVTAKIESLYADARPTTSPVTLPAEAAGQAMRAVHAEASKRLLGNGYCARPLELDCRYETICESCTMFFTTIEHRPTIQTQRDDATAKGQTRRAEVYDTLLRRLDDTPA